MLRKHSSSKAYPGLIFAEDITVCHTGNQGAKIVVKVSKMHSAFSRGRRCLRPTHSQSSRGWKILCEREADHRPFSAAQFIKLRGEPAPWGRGGLGFQSVLFRQQIPESSPACPQADGTKCKFLLERGDVNTLVIFPMLITLLGGWKRPLRAAEPEARPPAPRACGIVPTGPPLVRHSSHW